MTTPTLAEAVAARAKAREHLHCGLTGCVVPVGNGSWHSHSVVGGIVTARDLTECHDDHRTAAERDAAALAACADLASYFDTRSGSKVFRNWIGALYQAIQNPYEGDDSEIHPASDAIQRRAGGERDAGL